MEYVYFNDFVDKERKLLMPKGTKVDNMYQAMVKAGTPKDIAAATAQKRTGLSLKTGKPPKKTGKK